MTCPSARRLLLPLLAAAVALAGCTSPSPTPAPEGLPGDTGSTGANGTIEEPGTTPPPDPGAEPVAANVSMVDNLYLPDALQVAAGSAVRFTNDGGADHTVTLLREGDPAEFADRDVEPGGETVVGFVEAGTYKLRCTYHSASYDDGPMIGRITVG